MLIPFSFLKYVAIFNVVYWPLHAAGVPDGIAFTLAFLTWIPLFLYVRQQRRRRFYESLALEELAGCAEVPELESP